MNSASNLSRFAKAEIFVKKTISKIIVNVLLIVGFFVAISSGNNVSSTSWGSFHCIASMVWYALMVVHIWQHWRFTKSFTKWKVVRRNIITALTIIAFILMTLSIILFIFGTSEQMVRIHHAIAAPFRLVIMIHLIHKAKRLISLFKKNKSEQQKQDLVTCIKIAQPNG